MPDVSQNRSSIPHLLRELREGLHLLGGAGVDGRLIVYIVGTVHDHHGAPWRQMVKIGELVDTGHVESDSKGVIWVEAGRYRVFGHDAGAYKGTSVVRLHGLSRGARRQVGPGG